MRNKRTVETDGCQAPQKMGPINDPATGRRDPAVGKPVFGMRQNQMVAKKIEGLIDGPAMIFGGNILDHVGRVEDNPYRAAGKIGNQAGCPVRVADNVGRFRLDADQHAVLRSMLRR